MIKRTLFSKLFLLIVCVFLSILVVQINAKNYYEILEIEPEATEAQIKRAFRKLSLKYHPDKNPGDEEAAKQFVEISEAHDVLSNAEKKDIYDYEGYEGLTKGPAQRQVNPFEMMFGGDGGQGGRPKGPDARVDIPVTLEDLYNGRQVTFSIERNIICRKCRGSGAKDGETETCSTCKGRGSVSKMQTIGPGFQVQMQQPCDKCSGAGKRPKHKCPVCSGKKVVKDKKDLTVDIEKGMKDNEKIVFARQSEQRPGTMPGDVVVNLRQKPHHRFTRSTTNLNDLNTDMSISLKEALTGFSKNIEQLDGRQIPLARTTVTKPFEIISIPKEGMPNHDMPSEQGNMFVKMNIQFPDRLSDHQRQTIMKLLP